MRILFTGFDPFGGEKINPAGEAVKMRGFGSLCDKGLA
mgnify:CR=1 FL=1